MQTCILPHALHLKQDNMASWAAIAKAEPVKQEAKHDDVIKQPRVAVVDANAIINGEHLLSLMRFNDKLVTVPEVLREVRDKQSRQTLQNLPYTIQTEEPSEESVKSGAKISCDTLLCKGSLQFSQSIST